MLDTGNYTVATEDSDCLDGALPSADAPAPRFPVPAAGSPNEVGVFPIQIDVVPHLLDGLGKAILHPAVAWPRTQ